SRAGLSVIIHRIINPTISGYFTASLNIQSIPNFLQHYNESLGTYPMYAKFHPPGAILFFWILNSISPLFSFIFPLFSHLLPSHSDVAAVWSSLKDYQKFTALYSGFFIALLSFISLIP